LEPTPKGHVPFLELDLLRRRSRLCGDQAFEVSDRIGRQAFDADWTSVTVELIPEIQH
jgi:hypothetical protein